MVKKKRVVVKSKVIDAHILFQNPTALMRIIAAYDSIDSMILDLQEENPTRNITRVSVFNWKFMTNGDWEKYQKEKQPELLLTEEQNPAVSDTTTDDKK